MYFGSGCTTPPVQPDQRKWTSVPRLVQPEWHNQTSQTSVTRHVFLCQTRVTRSKDWTGTIHWTTRPGPVEPDQSNQLCVRVCVCVCVCVKFTWESSECRSLCCLQLCAYLCPPSPIDGGTKAPQTRSEEMAKNRDDARSF